MKVIITEKPSVANDIAKVLNVTSKKNGYFENNEYQITWAFGHLGGLANADEYDIIYKNWNIDHLPIIPETFKYKVSDNSSAKKQFYVIKELFKNCSEIIVATDSGREGEHIFRIIYFLSGVKKPFSRLWISSLTDKSIREGFLNLKKGTDYNSLSFAAQCRERFDWLIGINGTRCLTVKQHYSSPLSIGRVQTPTLAMIAQTYLDNKNFISSDFFVPSITLNHLNINFKAIYNGDKIFSLPDAELIINALTDQVKCTFSETKHIIVKQPYLFDLTTLQREANIKFGYSASETLTTVQSLYETKKMTTYPRTDSSFLTEDIYEELPELFEKIKLANLYSDSIIQLPNPLPKNSINNSKVTDHHAIIPTGEFKNDLTEIEKNIFDLILRRFIAAFSNISEQEKTIYIFNNQFKSNGTIILKSGWLNIYSENEENEEDTNNNEDQKLPKISLHEIISLSKKEIIKSKTKPKPLLTENLLLKLMENAGKNIDDSSYKEAMKERGLGTPATRAETIETLKKRLYITNQKKALIPTELGLKVYDVVKNFKISSPELTGEMEYKLKLIEKGQYNPSDFMNEAIKYTHDIISELKNINVTITNDSLIIAQCPKCKKGNILLKKSFYGCSAFETHKCDFTLPTTFLSKSISESNIKDLLKTRETKIIKGFISNKTQKQFNAKLILNDFHKIEMKFE